MTTKTPTPLRVGDAGLTIFGPPNGQPAPEVIATCRKKGYAAHLVKCANEREGHVKALQVAKATLERLTVNHGPFSSTLGTLGLIKKALAGAEGEGLT